MTKFKVAVCIPAFSDPDNIDGCVKSILESNSDHYELDILLFNNSNRQDIISLCKELSYINDEIRSIDWTGVFWQKTQ